MRKIFTLLFLTMMTCCALAFAGNGATTYLGTLSNIQMNEKTFHDLPNKTFVLTMTSATEGVIDGEVGKIGKMPGTLHFTIPVAVAEDGTMQVKKETVAGKMTMNIGLSRKLVTQDFTGHVKDGKLHFVLHITSGMLGITMADATVTFDGEGK